MQGLFFPFFLLNVALPAPSIPLGRGIAPLQICFSFFFWWNRPFFFHSLFEGWPFSQRQFSNPPRGRRILPPFLFFPFFSFSGCTRLFTRIFLTLPFSLPLLARVAPPRPGNFHVFGTSLSMPLFLQSTSSTLFWSPPGPPSPPAPPSL